MVKTSFYNLLYGDEDHNDGLRFHFYLRDFRKPSTPLPSKRSDISTLIHTDEVISVYTLSVTQMQMSKKSKKIK